ncbi:MAG: porin [Cytophagaceae bacterium]
MKKLALFTLAASMFSAFTLKAQDEEPKGKLTVSGYVDMYYQYNMNNPAFAENLSVVPGGLPSGQNPGRIFDIKHNQFSLGLVQTKFAYATDRSEVVIDLTYGPNAALGNFGNLFGTDINIKQAYMAYNATDKLTFTVGQFGTHIGYELIDAPLNYNYSLSYLFGNGPFYHTGAKAAYMFSDKVGLMAGIVNGWDGMYDFNKKKSAIAQLYLAPKDGWDVYINYVGGDERNGLSFPTIGGPTALGYTPIGTGDSIKTPSHLFDLTTTYQVNDAFKIGLNAAYGSGKLLQDATDPNKYNSATWYGAALYLNYAFSDVFGLGLRAEHFNDADGVRYVTGAIAAGSMGGVKGVVVNEFTLTGDIKLKDGHFNLKPEFRIDLATPQFVDGATDAQKEFKGYNKFKGDGTFDKTVGAQATIGMAAIYSF